MLKTAIDAEYGASINMAIVITGGMVSEQPGQLNTQEHIDTIIAVYDMIKEVFPDSAIYPVLGS